MYGSRVQFATVVVAAFTLALALTPASQAQAQYDAQKAAVKDYAMKALDAYKALGPEAAAADFMKPKKWLLGPDHFNLHVGLVTPDMKVIADSGFPELIGLNYIDVSDVDGNSLGEAVSAGVAKSPSGAALVLRFADPVTKAVAHAEGYCMRPDNSHVLCAWSEAV